MGPFLVYLVGLVIMVVGGFLGLIESGGNPGFLIPVLFGLFFFWVCWEIEVGHPAPSQGQRPGKK